MSGVSSAHWELGWAPGDEPRGTVTFYDGEFVRTSRSRGGSRSLATRVSTSSWVLSSTRTPAASSNSSTRTRPSKSNEPSGSTCPRAHGWHDAGENGGHYRDGDGKRQRAHVERRFAEPGMVAGPWVIMSRVRSPPEWRSGARWLGTTPDHLSATVDWLRVV